MADGPPKATTGVSSTVTKKNKSIVINIDDDFGDKPNDIVLVPPPFTSNSASDESTETCGIPTGSVTDTSIPSPSKPEKVTSSSFVGSGSNRKVTIVDRPKRGGPTNVTSSAVDPRSLMCAEEKYKHHDGIVILGWEDIADRSAIASDIKVSARKGHRSKKKSPSTLTSRYKYQVWSQIKEMARRKYKFPKLHQDGVTPTTKDEIHLFWTCAIHKMLQLIQVPGSFERQVFDSKIACTNSCVSRLVFFKRSWYMELASLSIVSQQQQLQPQHQHLAVPVQISPSYDNKSSNHSEKQHHHLPNQPRSDFEPHLPPRLSRQHAVLYNVYVAPAVCNLQEHTAYENHPSFPHRIMGQVLGPPLTSTNSAKHHHAVCGGGGPLSHHQFDWTRFLDF
jgi:hypothetical protein